MGPENEGLEGIGCEEVESIGGIRPLWERRDAAFELERPGLLETRSAAGAREGAELAIVDVEAAWV